MNCLISKISATALCICYAGILVTAQCPEPVELNITATLYSQENGLASNMLAGMAKDSTGYRYFLGVDQKWIRYDGVNFNVKNYDRNSFNQYGFRDATLRNQTVKYINNILYKCEKMNDGKIRNWAVNRDSLISMDVNKNNTESFLLPPALREYTYLTFFPQGEICWITSSDKVFRFDLRTRRFAKLELPITSLMQPDGQNPLFIFFRSDGAAYLLLENSVLKLNSNSTSFEKILRFSQQPFLTDFFEMIMDRYLFVVESNTIFYEANLDNGKVNKFDLADYTGIHNASALHIVSLKNYDDYLLIGTSNAGLFIFNRCTNAMQHFQYQKQSVGRDLTNAVVWLAVDDENVIWMQTEAGLIKLEVNKQIVKTYLPSSIKAGGLCNDCDNVRAIYNRDINNLLIGSLHGVYNFDLRSARLGYLVSPVDGKPVWSDLPISAITGDQKGNIFIASWGNEGILLLNSEKKKSINILVARDHPELSYNYLRCLFYDSHHVLWVGTSEGFLRINNLDKFLENNFQGKLEVTNQFPGKANSRSQKPNSCFTITQDAAENIWIGAYDGLYVYSYKTDSIKKYVHVPGNDKSISDHEVRSIYFSNKDEAWIGTNNGGLNQFDPVSKTFTAFTTENGLPNNSIYTILGDQKGFLWLGTNGGLCRFSTVDHSVRIYTPRDGIQNFEFNTNAVSKTSDERFCFGGRTGFNIFHPDSTNITITSPQVVISKFRIFDKEFPVTDAVMHLAHDENTFTFEFASLNYYRSNDNQYAYMMENADKDWIKSGNRQYTSYTNLPPGKYTFKVRAANYTGEWNKEVTSMKFIINPAWYNTWWFRLAVAILIAAGIYGLYRYRLRQLLKLHTLRNRIASDLHDEIGSTLSSISLSSTIIQGKLTGNNPEVEKLLQQVSSNTDNMMEALSDIVWAINTRNDRFDNVVNRMRAFAIEIFEPSDINMQFNVSEGTGNIQLDLQQRKNLYLIFKEAVNNIVKYSGCKNVYITMSRQGNKTFGLDIKDDGKGFELPVLNDEEKSLSGNGIRNMKKRAEELGGEMIIASTPGEGTTLNLRFAI